MKNTRLLLILTLVQICIGLGHAIANDASSGIPTVSHSMYTGRHYQVIATMRNTGTNTWTASSGYRLGSQNPTDNANFGLNRVNLSSSDSIAPGNTKIFYFEVTAPSTPGTYNFQWKMRQGSSWFGDPSENVVITVTADPVGTTTTTTTTTRASTTTTSTTSSTRTTTTTSSTSTTTTTTTTTTQPPCPSSPDRNLSEGDNAIDFQTPHDYPNNLTCQSNIYTCPAGHVAKVYAKYDTETWYDYFFIHDALNEKATNANSGNTSGFVWLAPPASMNSVWFSFSSDSAITRWGIDVDKITCYMETTTTSSATSTLYQTTSTTTSTSTSTTVPECPASPDSYLTLGINSVIYKTPRNYQGVIDCYSGIYTCPPGYSTKTHAKYDINPGHDFFYAINPASMNQTAYSGNSNDYEWLDLGYRSIRFRFTSDGSLAQWGVEIDVIECIDSPTTTSTTTSSTTTSLPGPCAIEGNLPPCAEVSLTEIVDSINRWATNDYTLGDVITLINSWADPAGHPAS
ncbi:MAG: NBR1-Ig-like domain-containing protein [Candidatus Altiarchaeia archaeon]